MKRVCNYGERGKEKSSPPSPYPSLSLRRSPPLPPPLLLLPAGSVIRFAHACVNELKFRSAPLFCVSVSATCPGCKVPHLGFCPGYGTPLSMSPLTALLFLGLFSVVVTSSTEAQGGEKARVCGKKLEDTILDITKNCEKERSQYGKRNFEIWLKNYYSSSSLFSPAHCF